MATASSIVVVPEFTSVGVNRVVNALDWGPNGLIAYCGHHVVCLYDPEAAEVIATLTGHTGQVNCVKWLPSTVQVAGAAVLVSGSADNTIRVWGFYGRQHSTPWTCITVLQGHESPVTSLAIEVVGQNLLLASTSADTCVRLWQCPLHGQQQQQERSQQQTADQDGSGDWQQQEELLHAMFGTAAWQQQSPVHVGRQIQHCVALATLPTNPDCVIMATGGTDCTVRLYVQQSSSRCASDCNSADQQLLEGSGSAAAPCTEFQLQCQLRGHENWVKGVAFLQVKEQKQSEEQHHGVSLLLASAGQDRYGRIWCISTDPQRSSAAEAEVAGVAGSGGKSGSDAVMRQLLTRYAPRPHLTTGDHTYWVTLEALLIGHEDWLHSVSWRHAVTPAPAAAAAAAEALCSSSSLQHRSDVTLLTTSQDRSMLLWRYDDTHQLWLSEAALGDAGASCLGFYGGAFNPSGDQLVAHGFTGALHLWRLTPDNGSSGSSDRRLWVPQHALGGHYGAVQDLCWGGDGGCLQSVGTDQTARLFTAVNGHWFELARTQVHGHDFSCLASIPCWQGGSSSGSGSNSGSSDVEQLPPACLLYVSGSEEKVLRVFEAPRAFTESLTAVRSLQSPAVAAATTAAFSAAVMATGSSDAAGPAVSQSRALGASVAALGLSNKAVYMDEDDAAGICNNEVGSSSSKSQAVIGAEAYNEGPDFVPCAVPSAVSGPPLEEHLAQNTLWPEVRKLYGHGNDVFCVCSSPSGKLIASACKAQSSGAAAVWLWEVGSWRSLAQLPGHTLTVTQLEFSGDGRYLLSCSRDRSFCVWRVPENYTVSQQPPQAAAAASQAATIVDAVSNGDGEGVGGDGGRGLGTAAEEFVLECRQKAAHSRIIWGISWAHDGSFFATGSRDQTVKLWARPQGEQQQQRPLFVLPTFPACVTAVALSPRHVVQAASMAFKSTSEQHHTQAQAHLLAVGMEDGKIEVWRIDMQQQQCGELVSSIGGQHVEGEVHVACQRLWVSESWNKHAAAVRRLRWAPACVSWLCEGDRGLRLASCGEDHSVRVLNLKL